MRIKNKKNILNQNKEHWIKLVVIMGRMAVKWLIANNKL